MKPVTMATASTNMDAPDEVLDLRPKRIWGIRSQVTGNAVFLDESTLGLLCGASFVTHDLRDDAQRIFPSSSSVAYRRATRVALSDDRRFLAVSYATRGGATNNNAVVKVYDAKGMTERASLSARATDGADAAALAFSGDGLTLVALTAPPAWLLVRWQWQTGRASSVRVPLPHDGRAHQVSVRRDDASLVCVQATATPLLHLSVVDSTLKVLGRVKDDDRQVEHLCHAWLTDVGGDGDGDVVTGTETATLVLWRGLNARHRWQLPGDGAVTSVAAFAGGFACVQSPDALRVFARVGGAEGGYSLARTVLAPTDSSFFTALSVSPSGKMAAVVTSASDVLTCSLTSTSTRERMDVVMEGNGDGGAVGMDLCERKALLVTVCRNDCVRVFNYATGAKVTRKRFAERVLSVAVHPLGHHLAVGLQSKLTFCSLLADGLRVAARTPLPACHLCAFSDGGHRLAVAQRNVVHVLSTVTYQRLITLDAHLADVRRLRWTADDDRLVTCGDDGAAYRWRIATGERAAECVSKGRRFRDATVSPRDELLLAVTDEGDALTQIDNEGRVRRAAAPEKLSCVANAVWPFAVGGAGGSGRFYATRLPLSDGDARWTAFPSLAADVALLLADRGARHLIAASSDGSVCVVQVTDRQGYPFRRGDVARDFAQDDGDDEVLVSRQQLDEQALKMAELEAKEKELRLENSLKERVNDLEHEEAIRQVRAASDSRLAELDAAVKALEEERLTAEATHRRVTHELKTSCEKQADRLRAESHQKLLLEYEKYRQLEKEYWSVKRRLDDLERRATDSSCPRPQIQPEERRVLGAELAAATDARSSEKRLRAAREENARLVAATDALKRQLEASDAKTQQLECQVRKANAESRDWRRVAYDLRRDADDLNERIRERDKLLDSKEKRVHDLTEETLRLRKLNSLLAMRHAQFIARTVLVRNGQAEEAMRTLNRILGNEGVFERFRRNRFYEKPFQYRRRKNYETCRALYDEDMSRKIAMVMRKNRADAYPGA